MKRLYQAAVAGIAQVGMVKTRKQVQDTYYRHKIAVNFPYQSLNVAFKEMLFIIETEWIADWSVLSRERSD